MVPQKFEIKISATNYGTARQKAAWRGWWTKETWEQLLGEGGGRKRLGSMKTTTRKDG